VTLKTTIMKELKLKPEPLTEEILRDLESRNLIKRFSAPKEIKDAPETDQCQVMYVTPDSSGGHQLLCVRKGVTDVQLTEHVENEDVIFICPDAAKYKPLYIVIGLGRTDELKLKAENEGLTEKDFKALIIRYNDPATSVFTIVRGTPHCELTTKGPGEAPVFYVTEPHRVGYELINFKNISLQLSS